MVLEFADYEDDGDDATYSAVLFDEWTDLRAGGYEYSYATFLEERIKVLMQNDEPHGHILSVRRYDLVPFIDEDDLQYVTEIMLEDIAETIWNSDDDGWRAMFDWYLEGTMEDNAAHWQGMIEAEKKRRAEL